MMHQLKTVQDGDVWHHECELCGATKTTKTPGWIGLCKKPSAEAIARVQSDLPCIHRGELTGETITGCLCHVPSWQKQKYKCAIHTSCVLLKLKNLSDQIICEGCGDRPKSPPAASP